MSITGPTATMMTPMPMRTRRSGHAVTATVSLLSARYSIMMTAAVLTATPIPTVTAKSWPTNRSATAMPGISVPARAGGRKRGDGGDDHDGGRQVGADHAAPHGGE